MASYRYAVPYLLLLVLVAGCTSSEESSPRAPAALSIGLNEVAVVGNDESAPEEALLGAPMAARSDSEGNIYVADRRPLGIRVYDSSGTYLRTIGSKGQGPGEMQRMTTIAIDNNGELLVADGMKDQLLRFSPDGTVVDNRSLNEANLGMLRYVEQLHDGNYVMLYRLTDSDRKQAGLTGPANLAHIVSKDLEEVASFATVKGLWGDTRRYTKLTSGFDPGKVAVVDSDEILYAPTLYRGELYRLRNQEGQWNNVQTLSGRVSQKRAYTRLEEEPPEDERAANVSVIHTRGDVLPAAVHNESDALFTLSDGRIIHFAVIQEGEERYLQAEVFSADGELEGWDRIDTFNRSGDVDPKSRPWIDITWLDERDRLYVLDYREQPVVRVFDITFTFGPSEGN